MTRTGRGMRWEVLAPGVFAIVPDTGLPLLYAPLQGLVLEANAPYVDAFRRALSGDLDAAREIGLPPDELVRFSDIPREMAALLNPVWPTEFAPTSVTLFLTHKCTLRCAYCYCEGGVGRDMPWPVLERAVRFTLENAVRSGRELRVAFHGGDVGACWPLFTRAVAFIEDLAADAGVRHRFSIGTNGYYTAEQAAFVAAHIRDATVSIDGIPAVHDACRVTPGGGPSLERTLGSVRVFERDGLAYAIRMTVTAGSVASLPESVAFLCEHTQARTIRAEPMYVRGRAISSALMPPDPAEFLAAYRAASEIARRFGRRLTYSGARIQAGSAAFCSYPRPTFGVTPDGDLTCCYEVLHPEDPLRELFFYGHVEPDGSAIVVDDGRVAAIRAISARRRAECAGCFCVHACAGDCAAKTAGECADAGAGAGLAHPRARCEITRALVLDLLRDALAGGPGAADPAPLVRLAHEDA